MPDIVEVWNDVNVFFEAACSKKKGMYISAVHSLTTAYGAALTARNPYRHGTFRGAHLPGPLIPAVCPEPIGKEHTGQEVKGVYHSQRWRRPGRGRSAMGKATGACSLRQIRNVLGGYACCGER